MVRRVRRSDSTAFWGCSTFPACRGARERSEAQGSAAYRTWASVPSSRESRPRFDRLVVACGLVGLAVGIGFIGAGLNGSPNSYAALGVAVVGLVGILTLGSPLIPLESARRLAVRAALLSLFLVFFFVALGPISSWLGTYLADGMKQAILTDATFVTPASR